MKKTKDLTDVYATMYIKESKDLTSKASMVVSKKKGDLEGADKKAAKDMGANGAKDIKKPVEVSKTLSPAGKQKEMKESTNMGNTFDELFNKVIAEADIEDIPAGEDDFAPTDEMGMDDEAGMEVEEGDKFSQLADLFAQAADLFRGMADGEGDIGAEDMGDYPEEAEGPMGEAVSEPEPRPLSANTASLQLPNKLGRDGVKVVKKKAVGTITGKHDGTLSPAPAGFKGGDKSKMKVGGSGPAATGKGASAQETA